MSQPEYEMPDGIPPYVAAAVGRSAEEKLRIIEHIVFMVCKRMEARGYEFDSKFDAPMSYFTDCEEAPKMATELIRHLMGTIWAEEIVGDRGLLAPTSIEPGFDLNRN